MDMAAVRHLRLLCVLALAGCIGSESSSKGSGGGTMVISAGGDPDALIPALVATTTAGEITDLVYERLADIGDALNIVGDAGFTPRLADHWTWSADSLRIAFHIDPRAKWHDGQPVRSSDVKFTLQSTRDSTLGSSIPALISNIDSVSTPDSATAVFWFHQRTPQQFYDATYQLSIMPEHVWKEIPPAQWRSSAPARHPIGSGQYRFASWSPRASIVLAADTANYRGAPKISRIIWSIAPDAAAVQTRFLAGEADVLENVRLETLAEIAKHPELRTKAYPALLYFFVQFNLRDPRDHSKPNALFADRQLRRALTMAVDRKSIVRSVFDSLAVPALGPTVRAYQTTDPNLAQIPYDTAVASHVLDSLGWRDSNGDGIRDRKGRNLEFTLSVPSSSKPRVQMAVLVQEQLRQVGVKVDLEQMEFPTLVDREKKRAFEAGEGALNNPPGPGGGGGARGKAGGPGAKGKKKTPN